MPSTIKRQSAAVMFTDIAGYTSIMASDEEKALSLLKDKRKILKPLIKQHNGVYVKGTGDGTLSYFDSAYNASKCAKLFQESIYDNKNMNVRVGIHVGDIVFDDGDVYGDGVNVASRLESMSPVGGICVSNTVYDELRNKKDFDGVELGLQSLKGVGRLIEIYGLKGDLLTEPKPSDYQDNKIAVHSDDEVPSIAIIPFENKGKEEDGFYAYGISADLISDCSGAGLIRVASLTDIENLDYKTLDTSELASKLFVRYIAQGSLWKINEMFQLSVMLYDTKGKKVVWSDRWQERWDNLSKIKYQLSDSLLKSLNLTKQSTEIFIKPESYEYCLKAEYTDIKAKSKNDLLIVIKLLERAIKIDNNNIEAKIRLGQVYLRQDKIDTAKEIFEKSLMQAKGLNDSVGIGYSYHSLGTTCFYKNDYDGAIKLYKKSLSIFEDANNRIESACSFTMLGQCYKLKYQSEKALKYLKMAYDIKFDLDDKAHNSIMLSVIGDICVETGKRDLGLENYKRALELETEIENYQEAIGTMMKIAFCHFYKGEYEKALESYKGSLDMQKNIEYLNKSWWTPIWLQLTRKMAGKKYDISEIIGLIKDNKIEGFKLNYWLYQLLEESSYLIKSYELIIEKADNLEPDVKAKFLSYPIPKEIVEAWEKVK